PRARLRRADRLPGARRVDRDHGQLEREPDGTWRDNECANAALNHMDASIISALAALTGATIGGLTSGIANWLDHRSQVRAQWLLHEKSRRHILYRDFIEEASRCYIDALQHHDVSDGTPGLVALYAKLNRMRVLSSLTVVQRAEHIAKTIMDTYLEP